MDSDAAPSLSWRWRLLLFVGPITVALAIAALIAGRGWFDHGPGVPSAGRPEAWALMWGGGLLVVLGHLTSAIAWIVLAASSGRHHRPLPHLAWWSAGYHLLVGVPFLWFWFTT